jgi:hypothetical protein
MTEQTTPMTQSALHLSHHTYSTQFACMMATHNEGNPEPQTASSMRNHGAAINQSSKCITTLHGTLDQPLSADGRQVPIPQGSTACTCQPLLWGGGGGEFLHVYMFAHKKSGIANRDGNRRSKTVVNHKREPHQQQRLLPSCTN